MYKNVSEHEFVLETCKREYTKNAKRYQRRHTSLTRVRTDLIFKIKKMAKVEKITISKMFDKVCKFYIKHQKHY